jgi:hypothetical protein
MFATKDTKQQSGTLASAFNSGGKHPTNFQRNGHSLDSLQFLQRSLGNHYLQALSLSERPSDRLLIQRACACGGSCAKCMQQQDDQQMLQPKLKIGAPNDKYEQEADRVADQVMRMPEPQVQRQVEPEEEEEETLQTKPLAEQITPLFQRQTGPMEEEEEEETLQAKPLAEQIIRLVQRQAEPMEEEEEEALQTKASSGQSPTISSSLHNRITALRGGGQPLPQSERAFFEPRFGADFSQVRVHTDSQANEMASTVNARAFTVEREVVFGAGQYQPDKSEGRRLLAHELTHVVQQNSPIPRNNYLLAQCATTKGAGGCGSLRDIDEDLSGARGAGRTAHIQIQSHLITSGILNELKIPRASKKHKANRGCEASSVPPGFADLWKLGSTVGLGEIKPVGYARSYGVEEVEHYIRRARQSMDRIHSSGIGAERCGHQPHGADDTQFDSNFLSPVLRTGFTKLSGIFPVDTVIGSFDGDRSRTLKARLVAPGAVGYWCTGGRSNTFTCGASEREIEDFLDQALLPAQDVIDEVIRENIERQFEQVIKDFDIRTILEAAQRAGILASIPFDIDTLTRILENNLGTTGRTIIRTLARRVLSIFLNELRTQLRNMIRSVLRNILLELCVGLPVVSLAKLLDELSKRLMQPIKQILPVVITATAAIIADQILEVARQAIQEILDFLEPIGRVLAAVAAVVLVIVAIVLAIVAIIAIFDPVPGDEVGLGAAAAAAARLVPVLFRYAFSGAPALAPAL